VVTTSPFRFTRANIASQLDAANADDEGFHGPRVTLAAPDMPPMGLTMERLPAGAKTRRYRTTANAIFHVTEGTGETTIGDKHFSWRRGDTLAAPGWHAINHLATSDAQLFVLSDEPLLRFSNYYRFEALE
jgi:gentisate 1,2-dioxygenase